MLSDFDLNILSEYEFTISHKLKYDGDWYMAWTWDAGKAGSSEWEGFSTLQDCLSDLVKKLEIYRESGG